MVFAFFHHHLSFGHSFVAIKPKSFALLHILQFVVDAWLLPFSLQQFLFATLVHFCINFFLLLFD